MTLIMWILVSILLGVAVTALRAHRRRSGAGYSPLGVAVHWLLRWGPAGFLAVMAAVMADSLDDIGAGLTFLLEFGLSGTLAGYALAIAIVALRAPGHPLRWNPLVYARSWRHHALAGALVGLPALAIVLAPLLLTAGVDITQTLPGGWVWPYLVGIIAAWVLAARAVARDEQAASAYIQQTRAQLAAVLGVAETQVPPVRAEGGVIAVGALPGAALARLDGMAARCATAMPDWVITSAGPQGMVLELADASVRADRQLAAGSGGLVTGAEAVPPTPGGDIAPIGEPQTDPDGDRVDETWDWGDEAAQQPAPSRRSSGDWEW